jgi:tetratricopeptide (TPR) repeat protein
MGNNEAQDWFDKGKEAYNSGNFEEAIKCYAEAAQLDLDATVAFYNLGTSFHQLARIKNDEALFRQSFEKYETAAKLNPNNAWAFYNWGVALFELARIKNDETLFRQSFEKYDEATQIDPHYDKAFFYWGVSLYELANITKDKTLFSESVQCFKKSKTDILHILVFFDNDDQKYILEQKILYPLLGPETSDGQFFMEITKNIDENKRDKYKEAYLLSVYIISKLHVNNPREEFVAYYREKTVSCKMLFDNTKFRLNAINYSNDPREGKTLLDYLYDRTTPAKEPLDTEYIAFAGCFSFNYDSLTQFRLYGKEDGREGTGLSLVFKKSFFSEDARLPSMSEQSPAADKDVKPEEKKHALFRCIYVDPETRRVETVGQKDGYLFYREGKGAEITLHNIYIDNIINDIKINMEELKIMVHDLDQEVIGQLLINLRYLTKHIAFKEEQECRIVKILNLKDTKIKIIGNYKQMHVKYEPKVSNHIEKIYFGPNAGGMKLFQDILTHYGLPIPCEQSKNPLV